MSWVRGFHWWPFLPSMGRTYVLPLWRCWNQLWTNHRWLTIMLYYNNWLISKLISLTTWKYNYFFESNVNFKGLMIYLKDPNTKNNVHSTFVYSCNSIKLNQIVHMELTRPCNLPPKTSFNPILKLKGIPLCYGF